MKRRTHEHPKCYELQAALGCSKPVAVGLLELLWHLTSDYCPAGDVGRFSDAQIARSIGYEGDASELIAALVSSGWLDASEQHRLVVHDWPEHADDYVHLRLARARLRFADGSEPSLKRMSKAERERLEATAPPKRTVSARPAHVEATAPPVSLPVSLPSPAVKQETKGHAEVTWRIERTWQRFLAARSRFYQERGTSGGPDPKLAADLRELIRTAIVEYDKGLLGASDRERWESDSYAAAAGEGLFLDSWMTGRDAENRKLFLESWRPWKPQKGKGHPVPRFAQLAFDARARVEPEPPKVNGSDPFREAQREIERARVCGADVQALIEQLGAAGTPEEAIAVRDRALHLHGGAN